MSKQVLIFKTARHDLDGVRDKIISQVDDDRVTVVVMPNGVEFESTVWVEDEISELR